MERCDECGYVYADLGPEALPAALDAVGSRFGEVLTSLDEDTIRRRPAPDTWSALEYTCHVRDVLIAQRERLLLALVEDRPSFAPIHRDERVVLDRYNAQQPAVVIAEVGDAARRIAWTFASMDAAQWERPCVYNYPAPSERSLTWLAQHTLHEAVHHLRDVRRVVA